MPTKDTDDRPVVEQLPAGGVVVTKDISKQRRKIIKASAAVVPAIMTIRSGAAAAMTSLNLCVERDALAAKGIPLSEYALGDDEAFATDEWVRVKGLKIKSGNDSLYGVPDVGGQYTVWYDESGIEYTGNVNANQIDRGTEVYLLAYVDSASGSYNWYPQKPVAFADQQASPITGSCLCSVNPDFTLG